MKIDLQYPYTEKWKTGYLVINPENRRTIILWNSSDDRSSTSYARYLMTVKLGRWLDDAEHVDHKDDDKTNDVVENLQILSQQENNKKSSKNKTYYDFLCPVCFTPFKLEARAAFNKNNPTCSRRCGGIKSHWKNNN